MNKDKRLKSDALRFRYINKFLKGMKILDIGSSEGNVHNLLKQTNPDKKIYSLDNSKKADFKMDLDRPEKISKKFDCVIAGEIIEHLESPIRFIKYCKSLLKKNGRLILTTPNAIGLQHLINPSWCVHYKGYRGHTQTFTIEMIKRILTDEKFKIIYSGYINAFWVSNPLQYFSVVVKRLRPDIIVVGEVC